MALREDKYLYDQTRLSVYGYGDNKKIKIVNLNRIRNSNIECDDDKGLRCTVNNSKLSNNICRAKSIIFEYAFCNPWDYFFTGTLNKEKYNREDLEKFHKDFTQWLRNFNRNHSTDIKFLVIPELHADGKSWHIHGLLYGLPKEYLKQFKIGDKMGKALAEKVKKGDIVYNWEKYSEKFGFCDLEPIKNSEAVSKYITKYISKQLASCVKELNAHLYYHSRGLNKAQLINKGKLTKPFTPTFENEYLRLAWLDYSEETLSDYSNSIIR